MTASGPAVGPGVQPVTAFIATAADTTLSEALITLRKRRLLVATLALLGLLLGFYKALTQIKLYEAFGRIQVRTGSSNDFKLDATTVFDDDPQRKMQTEVVILTSDTLMASVARDLNLANNPDFLGVKGPFPHRNLEDPGCAAGRGGASAGRAEGNAGRQNRHYPDRVQQLECEAFGGYRQQDHRGLPAAQLPDALRFDAAGVAVSFEPAGRSEAAGGSLAGAGDGPAEAAGHAGLRLDQEPDFLVAGRSFEGAGDGAG